MEAVGVEPTLFTTRERIYSPLQNTPYLQCLHDISLADALFAMLNGIICKFTVYIHSYLELTFTQWLTSAKLIPHLITLGV